MNVQKKKEKFLKRLDEAENGDSVKVIDLKRKHFKEEMSTSKGFGWQDLKDDPKEFYKWLIVEDHDVEMVPTKGDDGEFGVSITLTKCERVTS